MEFSVNRLNLSGKPFDVAHRAIQKSHRKKSFPRNGNVSLNKLRVSVGGREEPFHFHGRAIGGKQDPASIV